MDQHITVDGDVNQGRMYAGPLPKDAEVIGTVTRSGPNSEGMPAEPVSGALVELGNGAWVMMNAGTIRTLPPHVKQIEVGKARGIY